MALLIKKFHTGFTLIEAILSMTVLLLLGIGGMAANRLATASVSINQLRSQANILAEEGMEALMNARAYDFLVLSPGTFHPVFDGTKWTLQPGTETLGSFTRSVVLTPVMRDMTCFSAVCDITKEGGANDEGTMMADVLVAWNQRGVNTEIKLSSLITYWR